MTATNIEKMKKETKARREALDSIYYQSRVESFVEAWINVFIGFWINFTANLIILPMFGFDTLTVATNFIIGLLYTVISVARSYIIRRWAQEHLKRLVTKISNFIRRFI